MVNRFWKSIGDVLKKIPKILSRQSAEPVLEKPEPEKPKAAPLPEHFRMAGTEKTYKYFVIAKTSVGRVGYRYIGWGRYRIRLEPANDSGAYQLARTFRREGGWKQPGDDNQPRFSKVVFGPWKIMSIIENSLKALRVVEGSDDTSLNPMVPSWVKEIISRTPQLQKDAGFNMAGTEGTYQYVVVALTPNGRVGYRDLGSGEFRVRVEPTQESQKELEICLLPSNGWKQPGEGHQFRFSKMGKGRQELLEVLSMAVRALGTQVEINPNAPAWARDLAGLSSLDLLKKLEAF